MRSLLTRIYFLREWLSYKNSKIFPPKLRLKIKLNSKIRVLLSNLPLPFDQVGSWTSEFNYLLKQAPLFDYVLSPNPIQSGIFKYCKKRKWFKGAKFFKDKLLFSWIFRDYINELTRISKDGTPLQLLVIDDQLMLATLSMRKSGFPRNTELIYYHHGHSISLSAQVMDRVDKVFFLTHSGYKESVETNFQFTPEVEIIGNGVSSEIFYPLQKAEKLSRRKSLGFDGEEILIAWMANSRPVKGIHLFDKMISELLQLDPRIKIVIIGHSSSLDWDTERVIQKGRLDPLQVAEILQITDFYFFTSLWKEGFGLSLVEAIKCGNFIISSANGGIKDVVGKYERVKLIEEPNIVSNWIKEFGNVIATDSWKELSEEVRNSLFDFFSLKSWENRIRNGLR